jgi:hypothetical protein
LCYLFAVSQGTAGVAGILYKVLSIYFRSFGQGSIVNFVHFSDGSVHPISYSAENSEINQMKPEGVQNHIPPQRCVETIRNESNIKKIN